MESVHILEAGNVKVARLAGVVGQVEAEAPVGTDDEEVKVVAQADASARGHLAEETLQLEVGVLEHLVK